jgi:hypothetical protein
MKNLQEIAERIYKANKTIAINNELIKLNGGSDNPVSLALNAARMVINGKAILNFKY